LAGSAALEEAFAHPELESFSQRLCARCYLAPLNREETWQYMRAQLAAAGAAPDDVFRADAAAAVFDATDGVPRLVNQLCDRALHFAVAANQVHIDRSAVQQAWSDLQQIPTPWETPAVDAAIESSDVIEFGNLRDDLVAAGHDSAAVVDDETELDGEENLEGEWNGATATLPAMAGTANATSADPFAEKFDEEEVVLDNFTGWDDMFRSDVPRVENRRDPGFSTLVQAAIAASPASSSRFMVTSASASDATIAADVRRPRLRHADVPDSANHDLPLRPVSSPPKPPSKSEALDGVIPTFAAHKNEVAPAKPEAPVLIIEDDAARHCPQPPVRREEYRNLFSRLRSG
jgi:hypothetical protein